MIGWNCSHGIHVNENHFTDVTNGHFTQIFRDIPMIVKYILKMSMLQACVSNSKRRLPSLTLAM